MSSTLNTSRRTHSLYKTIGAAVAAAMLASSLSACKTMEKRSDGEKALIAAGVGILAAIVGKAAQTGKADSAGGSMEGKSAAAEGDISGDINAAKALQFLYGSKVVTMSAKEAEDTFGDSRCSEWVPWIPPAEYFGYGGWPEDLSGKTAAVCKVLDARYTEDGVEKYMMLTETRYEESEDISMCQYCRPIVGGFIFAKEGGQWKLETEDKNVSASGSWGESGLDKKMVRVGHEKYGMRDARVYLYQGVFSGGLGVIMPYGNSIVRFSVCDEENYDDVGTSDCAVQFDESSKGEYYDAIVSYKSRASKRAKEVTVTKRLRFVDGEYKEVKTAKKSSTKKRK